MTQAGSKYPTPPPKKKTIANVSFFSGRFQGSQSPAGHPGLHEAVRNHACQGSGKRKGLAAPGTKAKPLSCRPLILPTLPTQGSSGRNQGAADRAHLYPCHPLAQGPLLPADPSGYPDFPSLAHKGSEDKTTISRIQVDGASLQSCRNP